MRTWTYLASLVLIVAGALYDNMIEATLGAIFLQILYTNELLYKKKVK